MTFELAYHPEVKKTDLPKIDLKNKALIKKAIEERLTTRPELYGKPLRRTLKGYWKLRVGDYRVVFKIAGRKIFIFGIIHKEDIESSPKDSAMIGFKESRVRGFKGKSLKRSKPLSCMKQKKLNIPQITRRAIKEIS